MGIERKGKGKARKPPTPWLTPKGPKKTIAPTTNLKKKKNSPPTPNMHCGITVASSLVFSMISSLRRLSTALRLSPSFVVSRSPAGLAYRLLVVDPLDLCAPQKGEKHGGAGEAGIELNLTLRG